MSSAARRLLKGELVAHDPKTGQTKSIVFQINPESIRRRILPVAAGQSGSVPAHPRERITLSLAVDAQLDDESFAAGDDGESHGVLGFLSAVELLLYPANPLEGQSSSAASGSLPGWIAAILGIEDRRASRFVCLRLGSQRLIPVSLQSIQIVEEAFDSELVPIRASLRLVADTLSEDESRRHPYTRSIYTSYIRSKVLLAETSLQSE